MSEREQNRILEMLVACGSSDDDALDTVINMVEDYDQNELQEDLLLELNECY